MTQTPLPARLPSLDGWRALSIVMVLGAHTGLVVAREKKPAFDAIFDGELGVRFFFVISGFLITWLLVQEARKTGNISLKDFYVRRVLRIFPVYFAFVFVLLILQLFAHFKDTPGGWLGMLTFTRNYTNGAPGSLHFWSLAVEEQFYLIWPGLLLLLCRQRLRTIVLVLMIPLVTAPLFRMGGYLFYHPHLHFLHELDGIHLHPAFLDRLFFHYSFFCYFDTLACGCLCAVFFAHKQLEVTHVLTRWRRKLVPMAIVMILAPHVVTALPFEEPHAVGWFLEAFGNSLQALGFCVLLLHSLVEPDLPGYRILNWKWVSWLGVLSYSLYIWQEIFCTRAWAGSKHLETPDWAWYWLFPTFIVAIVSYYGLERPFFRLRRRYRHA